MIKSLCTVDACFTQINITSSQKAVNRVLVDEALGVLLLIQQHFNRTRSQLSSCGQGSVF